MSTSLTRNYKQEIESPMKTQRERQSSSPWKTPSRNCPGVAELVFAKAALVATAPAITAGDQIVSYGQLVSQANRMANYLIARGIGPEKIVGLYLNRSAESIISALAVLRSGAAFLPLDPAYPVERTLFILDDAQPPMVITLEEIAKHLSDSSCSILRVDSDYEWQSASDDAPAASSRGDDLAYVIYTSGSTGRPKGVEITHANLSNLVSWHNSAFNVSSSDRASHLASVAFDAAIWEVWPYLTAGASLHLPDETTRLSPEILRDWIVNERITISFLPTALAERLLTLSWPTEAALRFLLTGADVLHEYPTESLPFKLINNYGPTECTVVATSGEVPRAPQAAALPTIGRPIMNSTIHILDDRLSPVAPGTEGELYIGGVGVARGYLNRPDLTREKFIPDPFSQEPGARLYRTGDLARWCGDGEIAYVGRLDEQIKMLGYRIEPAEIERVLNSHSAVESSVVIARGSGDDKRLAAYLALSNGAIPSAAELRGWVGRELPEHMTPAVFVCLPFLPLTANGKFDRAALPAPDVTNTLRDETFAAPKTAVEQRLATILTSLLNLNDVSVNDNFFMLGGHSLLGTQLIARIRSAFGVDLTLRSLFESPTIAELSLEIERSIMSRVANMSEEEAESLIAQ